MTKRSNRTALPSFEKFRTAFLGVLKDHYAAEPLIPNILKDKAVGEQCAGILWPCVDPNANFPEISKNWRASWNPKFEDAIRGVEAAVTIYTIFDRKPLRVRFLNKLRDELLKKQQRRTTLPSKALGRDRDWTSVLHAKDSLESLLCTPLPDPALAALLNAAYVASGQENKEYTAQAIRMALTRLSRRLS
jgi:hypothetical protein